jgi:Alpha-2,8-polysialyltransferase (POLYST)
MTQVFYCSTFFGAMTLSAAIDAGCFAGRDDRRLLIVSTNAAVPEVTVRVDSTPGFETLRDRFDDVVYWNDLIAPLHPSDWVPGPAELPMLSRMVTARLGLTEVSELVVESIAVAPARTIARLLRDCPITVFSDGLMSYGPTRDALPTEISGRVSRLLYLDLVPLVEPLLLREHDVKIEAVPRGAFTRVLAGLPDPPGADAARGCPVIIGQYLSALGIGTRDDEAVRHADMLRAVAAQGYGHVVFKPHPAAGTGHARRLRAVADEMRIGLTVVEDSVPAEAWLRLARPALVVSCFSTALLTASRYFDLPVATVGCASVLEQIAPYQNSNRIPATIVDAVVPELDVDGTLTVPFPVDLPELLRAVGFCMQPTRNPDLRASAAGYLREYGSTRYFKRRRLEATGLVPAPRSHRARLTAVTQQGRRLAARVRRSTCGLGIAG